MKYFHRKRLQKLADYLCTIPKKLFNIHVWYEKTTGKSCKTIACAAGWATTIPSFRKAGFKLDKYECPILETNSCNLHDFRAISEFFGIDAYSTEQIFSSDGYSYNAIVTPKMVAKKIRNFLKMSE